MDIQGINSSPDKKYKKIKLKQQWNTFSQETTLHGLQNLNQSYSRGAKVIWLLVILGMISAYIVTVSSSIKAYFRHETRTTSQKVWNESLLFPTITFCSINHLSKTVAEKKYPILIKSFTPQPKNAVSEALVNLSSKGITEVPFIYANSTKSVDEKTNYNISFYDIMKDGFIPIKDTFYDCKWGSSKINCSDYIGIKITETSLCYYFPSDDIRRERPEHFLVVQAGPQLGLSATIDIHEEEYFLTMPTNTYSYGMKAVIHDPEISPVADLEGIDLAPGLQHNIGITREETKRLSLPYGKSECISQNSYSYESCLAKCLNAVRYKKCNCVPTSNGTDACYLYHLITCADFKAEEYFSGKCMCKPPCKEILYHTKISSLAFPSDIGYKRMKYADNINKTKKYVKDNFLRVNVFYNYMEYIYTEQNPAVTSDQLIGDIGGQLGLFLGASFITIAEFIEFFIKLCHNCLRNKFKLF